VVFKKHSVIYLLFRFSIMDGTLSETKKGITATNIAGYSLGLMGLLTIAATTPIAAILPLLFAPVVCGVFGLLLYRSQPNNVQAAIAVGHKATSTQN
jgi:hypothetical protein